MAKVKKPTIIITVKPARQAGKLDIKIKGRNFQEGLAEDDMPQNQREVWLAALTMLAAVSDEPANNCP
jgi:hypothetical protein